MNYAKETTLYMFRYLPRILLLMIIPSALSAFFMDPRGFGLIIPISDLSAVENFADIFFLVFSRQLITERFYIIPIVILLVSVSLAYCVGMIERHFRLGKMSLARPFTLLNVSFMPVLKAFLLLSIIYVVFKILLVCILTLLNLILGSFMIGEIIVAVIMALVSIIGMCFLLIVVRPIMHTSAIMLVYGYTFKDAFAVSLRHSEKNKINSLKIALILPFMIYLILGGIMVLFPVHWLVTAIFHTILLSLLMGYMATYIMIAMFDLSGIERRDNKKPY